MLGLKKAVWPKSWIEWTEGQDAYISVPFTWLLPQAFSRCSALRQEGYTVHAGGPAVRLLPHMLADVADCSPAECGNVLTRYNPNATFTTRGCIRRCKFCAVPVTEGDFRELDSWTPAPVVCDNNLTAASRRHWDKVIQALRPFRNVDFNQGLDARLLQDWHIEGLAELRIPVVRLAWDHVSDEQMVMDAISRLVRAGINQRRLGVYVLVNHMDTPDDAGYRCNMLKVSGIRPNVMRFQPLNTLRKNSYVSPKWQKRELARFCRYWNRQVWLGGIAYEHYTG